MTLPAGIPEIAMVADGFDEAVLGVAWRLNTPIVVYDWDLAIEVLMRDMSEEDAIEYMSFNVEGAYMGEGTPLFLRFAS